MPRFIFLILVLGLLSLTPAGSGFLHLGDSDPTTDSGWEIDPNG